MKRVFSLIAIAALTTNVAHADEIEDAITGALQAYKEGDTAYALEELTYAQQLLNALKQDSLAGFLPAPLDGWTREENDEMMAGMSVFGGGSGAAAEYTNGSQDFSIMFMADSPMVMSLAPMLANPGLVGKPLRIGRTKFIEQDGQIMGLVANRILIQAEGDKDAIIQHLEQVDFKAMASFGL